MKTDPPKTCSNPRRADSKSLGGGNRWVGGFHTNHFGVFHSNIKSQKAKEHHVTDSEGNISNLECVVKPE